MITRNNMPKSYNPINTLKICSNTLYGGGNLVAVGDVLPILIGKGEKPKIWLQALADSKENKFVTIIDESISKHPAVKVYEESLSNSPDDSSGKNDVVLRKTIFYVLILLDSDVIGS